jgi:alkylation response protein AidB-like acyl-CoA dehydrogenase
MDASFTPEQREIRDAIFKICARFGDEYWLKKDKEGGFPFEFHEALAADGWLGIAMPEEFGGSGLGITEAALMMQAIAESGAGMQGASAVHMNIFGLNPVVVFGTEEQKRRFLHDLDHAGRMDHAHGNLLRMPLEPREVGLCADNGEGLGVDLGSVTDVGAMGQHGTFAS